MKIVKEPKLIFTEWRHWYSRGTTAPSDPFDPPREFDVSGIYLLAHFKDEIQRTNNKNGLLHLNPDVIYIGQSKKVTRRLEGKRHEKEAEYKKQFNDNKLEYLYFSLLYTNWNSSSFQENDVGPVQHACSLYLERKLIWKFAKTYSKIPILNKQ